MTVVRLANRDVKASAVIQELTIAGQWHNEISSDKCQCPFAKQYNEIIRFLSDVSCDSLFFRDRERLVIERVRERERERTMWGLTGTFLAKHGSRLSGHVERKW